MKWFLVVALLTVGYIAAGPFLTMHELRSAVREADPEKLSANVDFPVLRANLTEQFSALMMRKAAPDLKNNPFEAFGMALATTSVNKMVNTFVTPTVLAALMAGQKPQQPQLTADVKQPFNNAPQEASAPEPSSGTIGRGRQPFQGARYSFDGFSTFSAWMKNDQNQDIRFVFSRNGLSWKLSNIVLPMDL